MALNSKYENKLDKDAYRRRETKRNCRCAAAAKGSETKRGLDDNLCGCTESDVLRCEANAAERGHDRKSGDPDAAVSVRNEIPD